MIKNPSAYAGDASSLPGLVRSPGKENGNPLQFSCLGNPIDRGTWGGYSPWGHKESHLSVAHMRVHTHIHTNTWVYTWRTSVLISEKLIFNLAWCLWWNLVWSLWRGSLGVTILNPEMGNHVYRWQTMWIIHNKKKSQIWNKSFLIAQHKFLKWVQGSIVHHSFLSSLSNGLPFSCPYIFNKNKNAFL